MDYNKMFMTVLLIASYLLHNGDGRMTLSIKDFLSDSNNTKLDHTQAFQDAWKRLCAAKAEDGPASLVIGASETYTMKPQLLQGPCASPNIHIKIDGTITAPKTVKGWGGKQSQCWLCFDKVTGLVFDGSGLLNGNGGNWWNSVQYSSRPVIVKFSGCQNIIYNGITHKNSPRCHVSVHHSTNVTLSNLHLTAPENSPNTDGVIISLSSNVQILDSQIATGDDCIAIKGGSSDINITSVACGPGHGISIGSLGQGGETETVENVNVRHCSFEGTQNGARIKTWPKGRGFVKNILYEHITLKDARFPIIIDQQYTDDGPMKQDSGVKVSDVTFRYFTGTCAHSTAIKLDCDKIGCDNIRMEHIDITSSSPETPLTAVCKFASVVTRDVSINVKCTGSSA